MIPKQFLFIILFFGCLFGQAFTNMINQEEEEPTDIFIQYNPAYSQERYSLEWISVHENVYESFFQRIDTSINKIQYLVRGWGNLYQPKNIREPYKGLTKDTLLYQQWKQYLLEESIQVAYLDSIGNQDIRDYVYTNCWNKKVFEECAENDLVDTIYSVSNVLCSYLFVENKDTSYWFSNDLDHPFIERHDGFKAIYNHKVNRCKILYPYRKPIEVDLSLLEGF